jgi:SAM-dependent methyltransferase
MTSAGRRRSHWDSAHRGPEEQLSWYQPTPDFSLELIERLAVDRHTAVIDVGGGTSHLADELLQRRFGDVTVLDISAASLEITRRRLGSRADLVQWIHADLLAWQPPRAYGLWHDRAVFHFLTEPSEKQHYRQLLALSLDPAGTVIVSTFAGDGPSHCSGLPVSRYEPEELIEALDGGLHLVAAEREEHRTPTGEIQPFTWIAARRRSG